VHSDVDATIGSIDFIGTVHIVGAVRENHSVTAVKGIKIDRGVQDGLIKSQADLAIGAAFVGSRSVRFTETSGQLYAEVNKKQSELVCGGHCKADLLQGLVAEVDGTLEVNREIRDCIVSVGEHLLIPHGQLMESAINTPWGVEIGTLGTEGGTPAIINLLADLSSTAEMRQVDAQVAQLLEAERLIKVHLGPLVEQPELLKKLESKHQAKVGEMLEKLTQVQSSLAHYQKQQQDLRSQALQEVQVNVLKAMYPGALVQCNGYSFSTSDVMNGPFTLRFNVNEGFSKEVLRKLPKLHKEEQ
jgi:uncharacterized protein (DUF342 family)